MKIPGYLICLLLATSCQPSLKESPFEKLYLWQPSENLDEFTSRVLKSFLVNEAPIEVSQFQWHVDKDLMVIFLAYEDKAGMIVPLVLKPAGKGNEYNVYNVSLPSGSIFTPYSGGNVSYTDPRIESEDVDGDARTELKFSIKRTGMVAADDGMRPLDEIVGEIITFKNDSFAIDMALSKKYSTSLNTEYEAAKRAGSSEGEPWKAVLADYPSEISSRDDMKNILSELGLISEAFDNESRARLHHIAVNELDEFYYDKCDDYGWQGIVKSDGDKSSDHFPVFVSSYQDTYQYKIVSMANDGKSLKFGLMLLNYDYQPVPADDPAAGQLIFEGEIYRSSQSWVVELERTDGGDISYMTTASSLKNFPESDEECPEEEY